MHKQDIQLRSDLRNSEHLIAPLEKIPKKFYKFLESYAYLVTANALYSNYLFDCCQVLLPVESIKTTITLVKRSGQSS